MPENAKDFADRLKKCESRYWEYMIESRDASIWDAAMECKSGTLLLNPRETVEADARQPEGLCPRCEGGRKILDSKCPDCRGTGKADATKEKRWREIRIRPLDFVLVKNPESIPWVIEGKLRDARFSVKKAETILDIPSTLPYRINRPFGYTRDIHGGVIVWQAGHDQDEIRPFSS